MLSQGVLDRYRFVEDLARYLGANLIETWRVRFWCSGTPPGLFMPVASQMTGAS